VPTIAVKEIPKAPQKGILKSSRRERDSNNNNSAPGVSQDEIRAIVQELREQWQEEDE
tara:strand:+ start:112 stop:285 length:174 start_codon:yes stop_codon:yes gene_type:complete